MIIMKKRNSSLKDRLKKGEVVAGPWCVIPSPSVIDIIAKSGADFVISEKDTAKMDAENKADAEKYIQEIVKTAQNMGIKTTGKVLKRNEGVAEDLAGYASKSNTDLIVIATHGRSGPSRWVWGSVADRILRSSCVPVLMVRAPGCTPGI